MLELVLLAIFKIHYKGLAAYAAMSPKFPCDAYLDAISESKQTIMPVLWGDFGRDIKCLVRYRDRPNHGAQLIEVIGIHEPCLRSGECRSYSLFGKRSRSGVDSLIRRGDRGTLGRIADRGRAIKNVFDAIRDSKTTVVVSPILESPFSPEANEVIRQIFAETTGYPTIYGASNSAYSRAHYDAIEVHPSGGSQHIPPEAPCMSNDDGQPFLVGQALGWRDPYPYCFAHVLWYAPLQGLPEVPDPLHQGGVASRRELVLPSDRVELFKRLLKD